MGIRKDRTPTGVDMRLGATAGSADRIVVSSGSRVYVESGGFISVVAGGVHTNAGSNTFTGTVAFRGTNTFEADSDTTISGSVGHLALVTVGTYGYVQFYGVGSELWIRSDASLSSGGTSGHVATVALGNYTTATWNGANSTWTNSAGTWTWSGGTLNVNTGTTFNQQATCNRTGADAPSGNDAVRRMRIANAPSTSGTIDPSHSDIWMIPSISGNVNLTLDSPAHPCEVTFICETLAALGSHTYALQGAIGSTLEFKSIANGGSVRAAKYAWTGTSWARLSSEPV